MALLRPYLPVICWTVVLLGLNGLPGRDMPYSTIWDILSVDKMGHFAVFAIFSCSLVVAIRKQQSSNWARQRAEQIAVIIGVVYGGTLERLQSVVFIDRNSDWVDMLANVLGVLFGVILFRLIYRKC